MCSISSRGRASSILSILRGGVGATLGEAEGRSESPDRDDDALALLGSLNGRPGGRLGLDADRADLEILALPGGMLPVRVMGV